MFLVRRPLSKRRDSNWKSSVEIVNVGLNSRRGLLTQESKLFELKEVVLGLKTNASIASHTAGAGYKPQNTN